MADRDKQAPRSSRDRSRHRPPNPVPEDPRPAPARGRRRTRSLNSPEDPRPGPSHVRQGPSPHPGTRRIVIDLPEPDPQLRSVRGREPTPFYNPGEGAMRIVPSPPPDPSYDAGHEMANAAILGVGAVLPDKDPVLRSQSNYEFTSTPPLLGEETENRTPLEGPKPGTFKRLFRTVGNIFKEALHVGHRGAKESPSVPNVSMVSESTLSVHTSLASTSLNVTGTGTSSDITDSSDDDKLKRSNIPQIPSSDSSKDGDEHSKSPLRSLQRSEEPVVEPEPTERTITPEHRPEFDTHSGAEGSVLEPDPTERTITPEHHPEFERFETPISMDDESVYHFADESPKHSRPPTPKNIVHQLVPSSDLAIFRENLHYSVDEERVPSELAVFRENLRYGVAEKHAPVDSTPSAVESLYYIKLNSPVKVNVTYDESGGVTTCLRYTPHNYSSDDAVSDHASSSEDEEGWSSD